MSASGRRSRTTRRVAVVEKVVEAKEAAKAALRDGAGTLRDQVGGVVDSVSEWFHIHKSEVPATERVRRVIRGAPAGGRALRSLGGPSPFFLTRPEGFPVLLGLLGALGIARSRTARGCDARAFTGRPQRSPQGSG